MRVEKKTKAFAYTVPIGDYNYLQCKLIIALTCHTSVGRKGFCVKRRKEVNHGPALLFALC